MYNVTSDNDVVTSDTDVTFAGFSRIGALILVRYPRRWP
jgi:hypothetical protein